MKNERLAFHERSRTPIVDSTKLISLLGARKFAPMVERYASRKEWNEIIDLLEPLLSRHGDEHWIHLNLSIAYFETARGESYEHLIKASELDECCPFVWLELARIFLFFDDFDGCVAACNYVINCGLSEIPLDTCCADLAAAESLINDCYYFLSQAHQKQLKISLAKKEIRKYTAGIKKGLASRFGDEYSGPVGIV